MRYACSSAMSGAVWLGLLAILVTLQSPAAFPSGHEKSPLNVKKSFLEDAMNEMEYGDKHKGASVHKIEIKATATQREKVNYPPKKTPRPKPATKDTFVARIYPSRVLHDEEDAKVTHKPVTTPSLTAHPKAMVSSLKKEQTENKSPIKKEAMESAERIAVKALGIEKRKVESLVNNGMGGLNSDIKINNKSGNSENEAKTLSALQDIVEKLLTQGVHIDTKKDTKIQGVVTAAGDTYSENKADENSHEKQVLNAGANSDKNKGSEEKSTDYELTPVYRLKATKNGNTSDKISGHNEDKNPEQVKKVVNALKQDEDDLQKKRQEELKNLQEEAQKLLVEKEKERELEQQQLEENVKKKEKTKKEHDAVGNKKGEHPHADSTKASTDATNSDSNKANGQNMDETALANLPKDVLAKLIAGLLKKKPKPIQVPKQLAEARKAYETARKLVKAAYAREQLYNAEQDFFEKVKEMMTKTEVAKQLTQKKLGGLQEDDGMAPVMTGSSSPSISKMEIGKLKSLASAANLPLSTLSNDNVLLPGQQGKTQKQFDEAAHMEEKVAEQQDRMYEGLIHQALAKAVDHNDDEDDDEDEQGVARDTQFKPDDDSNDEDYGDFQDKDEDAQKKSMTRSTVIRVRSSVTRPQQEGTQAEIDHSGTSGGYDDREQDSGFWSGSGD